MHLPDRRSAAFLLAALALLAGCAVGPDFVRPAPPTATGYTPDPVPPSLSPAAGGPEQRLTLEQTIDGDWWKLFGSRELSDVVARAIEGNPGLDQARETLAQAQEAVAVARGGFFPEVDLAAGAQRVHNPDARGSSGSSRSTLYSVGPSVSYALDLFGGVRRRVEQQAALADAQGFELAAAWLALSGNAVGESIDVASLRAQIAALHELLDDDEQNLGLVQRKFEAGKLARADVLSAQTQLASDRALLPPLEQQLAAARDALSVLAGRSPAEGSPPPLDLDSLQLPTDVPVALPSELVRRRPDILAAEAQLHAARAAIGIATADLYPQLTLSGSLARVSLRPGNLPDEVGTAWTLAADASAPLFHGGALHAQRRAALHAYQASLASYEQVVLGAFGQVADMLQALEHDARLVESQASLLDAARDSLRLQRISYQAGKTDLLRLLDSQRSYQQARLGFTRAQAQRLTDTAQLLVALGGGWTPAAS